MDTLPGLVMAQDERTRWYLLSMGSNENIHSVHFSGHVFTVRKKEEYKMAVYNLYPGPRPSTLFLLPTALVGHLLEMVWALGTRSLNKANSPFSGNLLRQGTLPDREITNKLAKEHDRF